MQEITHDPDTFIIKLIDFTSNASDLQRLPDGPRKVKLLQKYEPVVDIITNGLKTTHVGIKPEVKSEKFAQLERTKAYMASIPH